MSQRRYSGDTEDVTGKMNTVGANSVRLWCGSVYVNRDSKAGVK